MKVPHFRCDLHASFKVKQSKVRVRGGRGHMVSAEPGGHTAHFSSLLNFYVDVDWWADNATQYTSADSYFCETCLQQTTSWWCYLNILSCWCVRFADVCKVEHEIKHLDHACLHAVTQHLSAVRFNCVYIDNFVMHEISSVILLCVNTGWLDKIDQT